jgi:excisionase family DNA binding protein
MDITVKQAAADLGVCTKTIYRCIKGGSLRAIKYGERIVRIDEKDWQAFKDSHRIAR